VAIITPVEADLKYLGAPIYSPRKKHSPEIHQIFDIYSKKYPAHSQPHHRGSRHTYLPSHPHHTTSNIPCVVVCNSLTPATRTWGHSVAGSVSILSLNIFYLPIEHWLLGCFWTVRKTWISWSQGHNVILPRKSSCLPKGPNPAFHDQERLGNDDYMRLHATVITSTCDKFLLLRRMLNKIKIRYVQLIVERVHQQYPSVGTSKFWSTHFVKNSQKI